MLTILQSLVGILQTHSVKDLKRFLPHPLNGVPNREPRPVSPDLVAATVSPAMLANSLSRLS